MYDTAVCRPYICPCLIGNQWYLFPTALHPAVRSSRLVLRQWQHSAVHHQTRCLHIPGRWLLVFQMSSIASIHCLPLILCLQGQGLLLGTEIRGTVLTQFHMNTRSSMSAYLHDLQPHTQDDGQVKLDLKSLTSLLTLLGWKV